MVVLEFVVLTLGAFLQTVRHGVTTRYHGGCIRKICEERSTLVPLNKRIFTLLGEYGIVRLLSCFDVDPVRGLLSLAGSYEVYFDVKGGLG